MKSAPFIAVEGPIGAGKTTLATMLSHELNLPLVKEIVEENPFLASFIRISTSGVSNWKCSFCVIGLNNWKTRVLII